MNTIDLIIIIVYLFSIVVVGLLVQKKPPRILIHISWATGNCLGGFWGHQGWLQIRISQAQ